jgi:4a-hydroxytetrahydrobiopterin dehydratase
MADLLKPDEAKARLKKIPEWELEKKHIERTFEFDDFSESIDFVNGVAEVAEDEEHHPDIDIRYNKVRLVLSTHSKGGLTELDFGLAERIILAWVVVVLTVIAVWKFVDYRNQPPQAKEVTSDK